MTCANCEMRIENALKKLEGVQGAKANYSSSNVFITYDANAVKPDKIIETVEKLDYIVKNKPGGKTALKSSAETVKEEKMPFGRLLGIGTILLALFLIMNNAVDFNFMPEVNQSMRYGVLFIVGLLASLHYIGMCGGINLSQCVSYKADTGNSGRLSKLKPSLLYNSGMIMGLNMLTIIPWLRKLNPRIPKIIGSKIYRNNWGYGPFYIGLLNGLMPCGPLQAMQIYALGTGSLAAEALSMFFSVWARFP